LDGGHPEWFKMDFSQPGVRGVRASTRQRQFRSQFKGILAYFGHDVKPDFPKSMFHPLNSTENSTVEQKLRAFSFISSDPRMRITREKRPHADGNYPVAQNPEDIKSLLVVTGNHNAQQSQ
jgi:hypothetical protein